MLQITEELVEKLRNKDEEAFQKIYNAYVKLIYHIAYSSVSYTHLDVYKRQFWGSDSSPTKRKGNAK